MLFNRTAFGVLTVICPSCCLSTAGASLLIVNGMLTDLANFDLYTLMETIRKEVHTISNLFHSCDDLELRV